MLLGKLISSLSVNQLRLLSKILPSKYGKIIDSVAITKYVTSGELFRFTPDGKQTCIINKGEFPFPLFQVFFMESMISLCIYCMYKNYIPIIDFRNSEGTNLWEQLLEQPCGKHEVDGLKSGITCDIQKPLVYFPLFPNEQDIYIASSIYKRFVRFNASTQAYFDKEYEQIVAGKNVLGVLCRGTDYTANRPKGHPVQPSIDELIAKVQKELDVLGCDHIYLATEEQKIMEQFEQAFPGMILTNSRKYYDGFYDMQKVSGTDARISWVHHERENDNYWKSLEYMSSLNLLSKCKALIAGNCGGSRAALYLNGGAYVYWYLFDLGMY